MHPASERLTNERTSDEVETSSTLLFSAPTPAHPAYLQTVVVGVLPHLAPSTSKSDPNVQTHSITHLTHSLTHTLLYFYLVLTRLTKHYSLSLLLLLRPRLPCTNTHIPTRPFRIFDLLPTYLPYLLPLSTCCISTVVWEANITFLLPLPQYSIAPAHSLPSIPQIHCIEKAVATHLLGASLSYFHRLVLHKAPVTPNNSRCYPTNEVVRHFLSDSYSFTRPTISSQTYRRRNRSCDNSMIAGQHTHHQHALLHQKEESLVAISRHRSPCPAKFTTDNNSSD